MLAYEFTATLWAYTGQASWYFYTVPPNIGSEIKEVASTSVSAFGSVRVTVNVGSTKWQTSLFPDKQSGSYVLPVKQSVRSVEKLTEGSTTTMRIVLDA